MRLRDDTALHAVDSVFLGPPRARWPWRARYVAYGVASSIFVLLTVVERAAGLGLGLTSVTYTLAASIGATTGLLRAVNHERPLRSVVVAFVHEVTAPRPPMVLRPLVMRPGRLGVRNHKAQIACTDCALAGTAAETPHALGTCPCPCHGKGRAEAAVAEVSA